MYEIKTKRKIICADNTVLKLLTAKKVKFKLKLIFLERIQTKNHFIFEDFNTIMI